MLRWLALCIVVAGALGGFLRPAAAADGDTVRALDDRAAPSLSIEQAQALLKRALDQRQATDPVLARLADENVASAEELIRVTIRTRGVQVELQELVDDLAEMRRSLVADQDRVHLSVAAAGPVSSMLLRHQRELPTARDVRLGIVRAQQQSAAAEIVRIDLTDQIAALRDPREAAQHLLRDARATSTATEAQVMAAVETRRRDYLTPLLAAQRDLSTVLIAEEKHQADLAALAVEYRQFIDAQVLWLPNDAPMGVSDAARAGSELRTLFSAAYWQDILAGMRASVLEFPLRWVTYFVVLVVLVVYRARFKAHLRALGARVGTAGDRYLNSVQSLLLTLLLALPLPAALALFGSLLQASPAPGDHLGALSAAMDSIGSFVFLCTLILELSRPGGLAEAHFGWLPSALSSMRRGARIIVNVVLPLLFVSLLAVDSATDGAASALGRLTLVAALLVLGVVAIVTFNPSTGLFAGILAQRPRGWLSTLRGIWYPALVAIPFAQAVGAAAGYVFTTVIILNNMVATYWVIVVIALGLSMLERLFQSTSDRFAWRRGTSTAEQRRLGEQVGRVIRLTTFVLLLVGVLMAWSDVIPALGFMRSSTLWTVGGGDSGPVKNVSLRDLLVFGLVTVLTVQLVRDLPGVLGLALLQRFPLDDSARYAIVSLGRYVLVLAGIVAGFAALKIGWSNVQWLAAAVTVGLGFGLQEIFANFVSGLIMLAERPVRIGDMVTVENVSGRVVKIATRATTLVDGEEKEIIIPNKQFITTRITNWQLDDGPVRFTLAVGVAYGADLKQAEATLRQALDELPLAVKDPAPAVALRALGANAVEFDLSYCVAKLADNMPTRSALIMRVDELFRERAIEFALPQMDVRLRQPSAGGTSMAGVPLQ